VPEMTEMAVLTIKIYLFTDMHKAAVIKTVIKVQTHGNQLDPAPVRSQPSYQHSAFLQAG